MASAVRVEPNHYEVLGLSPTASQEDIARAFARATSLFGIQPVALASRIFEAFEVLRNPAKREAYNRSMGLTTLNGLYQWQYKLPGRLDAPSKSSARPSGREHLPAPPKRQEAPGTRDATPKVSDKADVAEVKLPPFVLSLQKLAEPAAPAPELMKEGSATNPVAQAHQRIRSKRKAPDSLEPVIEHILALGRAERASLRKAQFRAPDWRRPAMALGGVLLGAGILGVGAGLSVASPQDAGSEVTETLPAPSRRPVAITASPGPDALIDAAQVDQPAASPVRPDAHMFQRTPNTPPKGALTAADLPTVESPASLNPEEGQADASEADPLAPTPVVVEQTSARMPLPGNLVARTIGRIGYRCGEVASMTAIEDASGAFKVTCKSGDTYRAAPLRGRYHFRRMASR